MEIMRLIALHFLITAQYYIKYNLLYLFALMYGIF